MRKEAGAAPRLQTDEAGPKPHNAIPARIVSAVLV